MYYENYLIPETDIDEEFTKCGVCGKNHILKNCSLIGNVYPIKDTPTIPQSRLSLPQDLEVRTLADSTTTVITLKKLDRGVQFGPFKAKRSHLLPLSVVFPLKVFLNSHDSMYLETDDEEFCNWMCLVAPASTEEDLNMYCYQEKEDIYFSVIKEIEKGSELKVWYAPHYATKMCTQSLVNIEVDLDEKPLMKEGQSVSNSFTDSVDNHSDQVVILQCTQQKKKKKKLIGTPLTEVSQNQVNKLPATLLGAKEEKDEWTCSVCSAKENNVAVFAQHVMTHYQPNKDVSLVCDTCGATFKSSRKKKAHKQQCKKLDDVRKQQDCKRDEVCVNSQLQQEQQQQQLQQNDKIKNSSEFPNEINSKPSSEDIFVICEKDNTFEKINFERLPNLLSEKNDLSEIVLSEKSAWSKNLINEVDCDVPINVPVDTVNLKDRNLDQIHPTILDLSDEFEFQSIKSFSDTIGVDNNLDKSFSINRTVGCLDLFDGVGVQNLLNPTDTCGENNGINSASALQTKSSECNSSKLLLLKKDSLNSGFIVFDSSGEQFSSFLLDKPETQKFETSMEVTDEDKNRIVENLLTETHNKLNMSVYDVNSDGDLMKDDVSCNETVVKNNMTNDRTSGTQNTNKIPKKPLIEKKFKCDICKKCFVQPKYLYRHLRRHTGEFSCHSCMTVFARKETLYKHICHANSSDAPREKYPCKSCDKVMCSYNQLKKHESKHRREDLANEKAPQSCKKAKLCEVCGAIYSSSCMLQIHMLMHSGKPFKCNLCGKCYHRRDLLQQHMSSHGPPQVACPVCSKLVRTTKSLKVHLKTHSSYKPLACDVCSKRFFQKGNLMKHIKMHYVLNCTLCKQTFTSSEELEKHTLTHANEKTYSCTECDQVFLKEGLLKKHYRTHNTSDFYNCRYCHMAIRYRKCIKKHLARQHPEMKPEWDSPGALEAMIEKKAPSSDSTGIEKQHHAINNNTVNSAVQECSSSKTRIKSASNAVISSGFTVVSGPTSTDQLTDRSATGADMNLMSTSPQECTTSLIHDPTGKNVENTDMTVVNEQKTVFVEEGMILEQLRMGGEIFLYLLEPNDDSNILDY